MTGSEKVRFPNLNALRFFAAVAVMVFHIEHKKSVFGIAGRWNTSYFVTNVGYHAVTFFFVLSGFLITFLLLKEKAECGRISLPKFYMRRILRISPVYYVTILVGYLILPRIAAFHIPGQTEVLLDHWGPAFLLSLFYLSNVVISRWGNMAAVDQSWSVSTEEQFYLTWPIIMSLVSRRFTGVVLSVIAAAGFLVRFAWLAAQKVWGPLSPTLTTLLTLNRFGCMAIGGLGALLVIRMFESGKKDLILRPLLTRPALGIALFAVYIVLSRDVMPGNWQYVRPEFYSVLFLIVILNFSVGCAKHSPLDGRFFRRAGDLSYAAYMYHNIFVALGCNVLLAGRIPVPLAQADMFLYPFVFATTFLASWLSYSLMEAPALRLKEKFAVIKSSA